MASPSRVSPEEAKRYDHSAPETFSRKARIVILNSFILPGRSNATTASDPPTEVCMDDLVSLKNENLANFSGDNSELPADYPTSRSLAFASASRRSFQASSFIIELLIL
jgi:hypothetical protein